MTSPITAGIYLHIPFCRKACVYCDFHFSTHLAQRERMVATLQKEIKRYAAHSPFSNAYIETIYFGGGTPNILTPDELAEVLSLIHQLFSVNPLAEITLEANPEDLTRTYLNSIKSLGINRLSIGTQSLNEEVLQWMNRSHSAAQALTSIAEAHQAGFDNISADLIFHTKGITPAIWEKTLLQMAALPLQHLSLYGLTIEPRTALHAQVKKGQYVIPKEEDFAQQFIMAHEVLTQAGFDHYEISNYGKTNYHSRHNTAYWSNKPYLGIGPSAHSHIDHKRWWNKANNSQYIEAVFEEKMPIEAEETLNLEHQAHEYLMTRLRTATGIELAEMEKNGFPLDDTQKLLLEKYAWEGRAEKTPYGWKLTPSGWLIADEITAQLF